MSKRKVSNPLALAVLAALSERSMHPYELAAMLRERGKEQSIRMNYGSLYTVVDALVRSKFIEPVETFREGRRPERTVYALTPAGRAELDVWLGDILRTPAKEYPEFEAGLSLMPVLPPDVVTRLLSERVIGLEERIRERKAWLERMCVGGLPRLFTIEADYECALLHAELEWVRNLARQLEAGTFEDLDVWRRLHQRRPTAGAGTGPRAAHRAAGEEEQD